MRKPFCFCGDVRSRLERAHSSFSAHGSARALTVLTGDLMKHSTAVCRRSIPRSIQYHGCDSALTRAPARVAQTRSHSDSDHVSSVNPWRRAEFVGAGTMLRLLLPYSLLALPQMRVFFRNPSPRLRLFCHSRQWVITPVFPSTQARGAAPHVVAHPRPTCSSVWGSCALASLTPCSA